MTTYYEIPLTPAAQQFRVTLGGVPYQMRLAWRSHDMGGWFLDVSTSAGVLLVAGVPLVTGADLLAPYPDLGFPGALFATTDGDVLAPPTYDNLGSQSHVYFKAAT